MDDQSNTTRKKHKKRPKVARLIDEFDLHPIGEELEHLWTTTGDERRSLRDLAEYFNHQLLAEMMSTVGMQALDGEVENIYRLLTGDVSKADRTRIERRLESEGVDVEKLLDDFVTYQAMRTYLREYRGAEYSASEGSRTENEKANLQRLRSRTAAVTETKFEQLRDGNHIDLGEFSTIVEITILCEDCGNQYDASTLLDRGACACNNRE